MHCADLRGFRREAAEVNRKYPENLVTCGLRPETHARKTEAKAMYHGSELPN